MNGTPDRFREWAAHWLPQGHPPGSGVLLAREFWRAPGGGTERWGSAIEVTSPPSSIKDLRCPPHPVSPLVDIVWDEVLRSLV